MIAQTGLLVIIDLQGGGASVTYVQDQKMLVLETETKFLWIIKLLIGQQKH